MGRPMCLPNDIGGRAMTGEIFWIAFGDVHENLSKLGRIPDIDKARGILISGDLTNVGTRAKAEQLIEQIKAYNPNIYAQIGNMDTKEVEEYYEQINANVHNKLIELSPEVPLLGLGYSIPTPFGTPSEVEEKQMDLWLTEKIGQARKCPHLIFMSHTPPYQTKTDKVASGISVGSLAVRKFIEQVQPEVCITGHIHEARAVDHIGETKIINPGAFGSGGYVKIVFENNRVEAEFLQV
ncbi:metallophosphoesterase family protein [Desulfovulcanus sp.]